MGKFRRGFFNSKENCGNMNKYYITFGQNHVHTHNGKILNKNTVAILEIPGDIGEAGAVARHLFGGYYSRLLSEMPDMTFFPGGFVEL